MNPGRLTAAHRLLRKTVTTQPPASSCVSKYTRKPCRAALSGRGALHAREEARKRWVLSTKHLIFAGLAQMGPAAVRSADLTFRPPDTESYITGEPKERQIIVEACALRSWTLWLASAQVEPCGISIAQTRNRRSPEHKEDFLSAALKHTIVPFKSQVQQQQPSDVRFPGPRLDSNRRPTAACLRSPSAAGQTPGLTSWPFSGVFSLNSPTTLRAAAHMLTNCWSLLSFLSSISC